MHSELLDLIEKNQKSKNKPTYIIKYEKSTSICDL